MNTKLDDFPGNTNDSLYFPASVNENDNVNIFTNSESFPVRTIVIDGEVWFVAKDVASIIGYENTNCAILQHVDEEDKKMVKISDFKDNLPAHMRGSIICIMNSNGILSLISKSNKISSNQKDILLKKLGLSSCIHIKSRVEIEFKECLSAFFLAFGYKVIHQYKIGPYRIDFFIPKINTGIEYDENDHLYYNELKEEEREEFIRKTMGCDIIRISDKNDNYYNLGIISKRIMEK